jgi:hypothetical protein
MKSIPLFWAAIVAGALLCADTVLAAPASVATGTPWVIEVDEPTLLADPALLHQAMVAAIQANDIAGMQVLLPFYEKLPHPDPILLAHTRAVDARAQGKPEAASRHYRDLLRRHPDAHGARLRLAESLIENREYAEARQQLALLPSSGLSEEARRRIARHQQLIDRHDSWSWEAGARLFYDANVNNAPSRRHVGNWTFDMPRDDHGIAWHAGAAKLWPLPEGRSLMLTADLHGKHYFHLHDYRDMSFRLAFGPGHANLRRSLHLAPFIEYRLVGGQAYSHTVGLRAQWDRYWTPSLQSLVALEAGRQKHHTRSYLDNRNHLASIALVYRPDAAQHAVFGVDAYREWGTRHPSDSGHLYSFRAAWAKVWPAGPGLGIQVNAGTRRYQGPTLLSGGHNRRDHILGACASLWHRRISHAGFTPRLTLSQQRTRSNDTLQGWRKRQLQVEVSRVF